MFLGVAWTILPSLFITFSYLLAEHAQIVTTNNDSNIPTFVFLLVGLFVWQSFSEAIQAPVVVLNKSKKFFLNINLPIETYVFSKFFEVFLFSLLRHVVTLILVYFYFELPSAGFLASSFLYMLLIVFFGFSIGIFIAPLGILVQDFTKTLTYVLGFALFCTPVLYKKVDTGLLAKINDYNPMAPLFVQLRSSLIFPTEHTWMPDITLLAFSFLFFMIGAVLLKLARPIIYERVGL